MKSTPSKLSMTTATSTSTTTTTSILALPTTSGCKPYLSTKKRNNKLTSNNKKSKSSALLNSLSSSNYSSSLSSLSSSSSTSYSTYKSHASSSSTSSSASSIDTNQLNAPTTPPPLGHQQQAPLGLSSQTAQSGFFYPNPIDQATSSSGSTAVYDTNNAYYQGSIPATQSTAYGANSSAYGMSAPNYPSMYSTSQQQQINPSHHHHYGSNGYYYPTPESSPDVQFQLINEFNAVAATQHLFNPNNTFLLAANVAGYTTNTSNSQPVARRDSTNGAANANSTSLNPSSSASSSSSTSPSCYQRTVNSSIQQSPSHAAANGYMSNTGSYYGHYGKMNGEMYECEYGPNGTTGQSSTNDESTANCASGSKLNATNWYMAAAAAAAHNGFLYSSSSADVEPSTTSQAVNYSFH